LRDGTGDVARLLRLRPRLPSGFRLLSGDDATALACLACGGDGAISTIANVAPDLCRVIFSSGRQGRWQCARYLQKRLVPLTTCLARENPAALKYALSLLGMIRADTRLPLAQLDDAAKAEVESAMAFIADEALVDAAEA
jgi:4-hydroxy-tetrahydrodipicolinate synthase